jgi:hypothetical protein
MSDSDAPLLSSSVSVERQTLWFERIELIEHNVVISGWSWTGPIERPISLDAIRVVDRWEVTEGPNFVFQTERHGALRLRIQGAWHWQKAFQKDPRIELKRRH